MWRRVYACLETLLEEGIRYFSVGGALGFDTFVVEKPLILRESRPLDTHHSGTALSRLPGPLDTRPAGPVRRQ